MARLIPPAALSAPAVVIVIVVLVFTTGLLALLYAGHAPAHAVTLVYLVSVSALEVGRRAQAVVRPRI